MTHSFVPFYSEAATVHCVIRACIFLESALLDPEAWNADNTAMEDKSGIDTAFVEHSPSQALFVGLETL
jgi:hypothetical protein